VGTARAAGRPRRYAWAHEPLRVAGRRRPHPRRARLHPPRARPVLLHSARVADGFYLRTWRGAPQAGQPKVPLAAQGLLARGLVRLDASLRPPRLFFTEAGLAALRVMMADPRLADPKAFAHVRQELGIEDSP
jgi:hypothetical protein